ncbi:MAG: hypothetical protein ACR2JS_09710 [Candidatus Nanopelagicales bacterium]
MNTNLPSDEELLRGAIDKIRRKEYGQLTDWEHAAVMFAVERAVVEYTMNRYANNGYPDLYYK